MRRDRSPSEDRGRAPHPVWDNPGSQLVTRNWSWNGFGKWFVWYFKEKIPFCT